MMYHFPSTGDWKHAAEKSRTITMQLSGPSPGVRGPTTGGATGSPGAGTPGAVVIGKVVDGGAGAGRIRSVSQRPRARAGLLRKPNQPSVKTP